MTTVDEIRKALDEYDQKQASVMEAHSYTEAKQRDLEASWMRDKLGPDYVRTLLARLDKLEAFVAAMRETVHDANHDHHLATNWTTARIEKALAALDAGEE